MTRENREMDIRNYITYLNEISKHEVGNTGLPVTILGFSQGAATASRWAIDNTIAFHRLILWSGIFPPDMDFEKGHNALSHRDVCLVYGTKDPLLTDARMNEMKMLTSKLQINPEIIPFEGGHEIDPNTLEKLA
jgi:predicted esterase